MQASEWISRALLEHNTGVKYHSDVDNNNKEFWTAVWVMPSEHAGWPSYMANYSHVGSVPRCLCIWKCSDNIMHVCNTPCFHFILQYAPNIVTIRAPLNGDQLCGHVYAHLAWHNYSNNCCSQQTLWVYFRRIIFPEEHYICLKFKFQFQNNFSNRL